MANALSRWARRFDFCPLPSACTLFSPCCLFPRRPVLPSQQRLSFMADGITSLEQGLGTLLNGFDKFASLQLTLAGR